MRRTATFVTASILAGAAVIAAPGIADARFGASAITNAVTDLSVAQPAQYRRTYRRNTAPRTYTPPPSNTVSPYRYPGSQGALLNCSFC
jgi:hypothetical protein